MVLGRLDSQGIERDEVGSSSSSLPSAAANLGEYMWEGRCQVGLTIRPQPALLSPQLTKRAPRYSCPLCKVSAGRTGRAH